jgi:hypothetical protein
MFGNAIGIATASMHISRVRPSESPEKYEGGQNRRAHAAGRCDMQDDIGFSFPLWPGVAGTAGTRRVLRTLYAHRAAIEAAGPWGRAETF